MFSIGLEAAPNSDVGGTWLGKFICPPFVERAFLPSIADVLTPPCGELLTGVALFSDNDFLLCALGALLLFDKSASSVLPSVIVVPF